MKATTNKDGLTLQLTAKEAGKLRTLLSMAKNNPDFSLSYELNETANALLLITSPQP